MLLILLPGNNSGVIIYLTERGITMHLDLSSLESSKDTGSQAKNGQLILTGKRINLRLAEIDDAEYILGLRTDKRTKKYISLTENSVKKQIEWLREYKHREADKREYYFIIESKNNSRIGTARIYDLQNDYFWFGSWIIESGSPFGAAVESQLMMHRFGFYTLGMSKSYSNIKRFNQPVIKSQLRLGARIVGYDSEVLYFEIARSSFKMASRRYVRYLSNPAMT